jgi:hypothetical protein
MRNRRLVGSVLTLPIALLCAACSYTPNHYLLPRTVAPGTFTGVAALDAVAQASPDIRHIPTATFHGRVGIFPRVDLGVTLNLPSASLSIRTLIYKSKYVDLAWFGRFGLTYWAALPIDHDWLNRLPRYGCPHEQRYCDGELMALADMFPILGINVTPDVTIALSPGAYVRATAPVHLGYRIGLGIQWRVIDEIALHPEVSYMPDISPLNSRALFYGIGIVGRGRDGYRKRK